MSVRIVSAGARPDLADQADQATADAFPEYNKHGDVLGPRWSRLYDDYPAYQLVLWDDATGEVLGEANTIPCRYDGTVGGLPRGIDEVIATGLPDAGVPPEPTALCALAIAIPPGQHNRGQSRLLLEGMRALAAEQGWAQLIAPVRPNWKARYPLTPIQRYAAWTRPDGLPFDPWLRVHVRLGGRILRAEPQSLRISGTVGDWEEWVGMAFPETGRYVFPEGLALLHVDRERDVGLYHEPNVWVAHDAQPEHRRGGADRALAFACQVKGGGWAGQGRPAVPAVVGEALGAGLAVVAAG